MSWSTDTTFLASPGVAARSIENGAVLVDMRSGACFELNRVGFEIWERLLAGASPGSIHHELSQIYSVDAEHLTADIQVLVQSLLERGLILPCASNPSPSPR